MSDTSQAAPDSPAEQALFAQRKLERLYRKTHQTLKKYKSWVELSQEVLVWKRPVSATILYLLVHWLFITYVQMQASAVTLFGNLIFWVMVADILWRAAQRPNGEGGDGGEAVTKRERRGSRARLASLRTATPLFDAVFMQRHSPREPGQLPSFEVICIFLAEILMWVDNIWLALRHWSISEPIIFCVAIGVPGAILSLLGKYIPTVVLLYIVVMGVVTWPYIEFHNLRSKAVMFVQTHYPDALERLKNFWKLLKTLAVSRDREVPPELLMNEGEDEQQAQQALQDAFDQVTSNNGSQQQQQQQQQLQQQQQPIVRQRQRQRQPVHSDPGLSLLQDSVLGLPENAFQGELDSLIGDPLAPGPGEFPSISNLDQSLALGRFPSDPSASVGPRVAPLPAVAEVFNDDDVTLPEHGSQDLDPFSDSIEVEFGGYDFTDQGSSRPMRQARVPSRGRGNVGASLTPSAPLLSNIPEDTEPNPAPAENQFVGNFVPPPSYHSAVTGADGGYSTTTPQQEGQWGYEWPEVSEAPKSSSTPSVEDVGTRQRR